MIANVLFFLTLDGCMNMADWIVVETTEGEFNPTQLHHKETVFTLSNGYLGTRGTFEEGYPGNCPATLINGVYDRAPVVQTELANCPDWLSLTLRFGHYGPTGTLQWERFRLDEGEVLHYQRWLNLHRGLLSRSVRWQSPSGQILTLRFERFVSLADQHTVALRCQIESDNFTGPVEVHAGLNGYPDNQGLMHWEQVEAGADQDIWLAIRSRASKVDLGMAAKVTIAAETPAHTLAMGLHGHAALIANFEMTAGQTVTIEKLVTVFTSRETKNPLQRARQHLASLPDYVILLAAHEAQWATLWQTSDIVVEGDSTAQLALRYNLFQLLSVAPRHDDRVSIPAKALSGFAYRGHIFWDTEIFILPFLSYTQPALARNLLMYRYHTLAGARRKAQAHGYEGAMYVWESADTGDEVTPSWVPHAHDPKEVVRIWCGEIELHISADVAYAAYQYWQATGDDEWMRCYGAEMILDTAVFWGSRVEWNPLADRYEIRHVIGPDEYHERVDNNAFTNRMVQWHLQTALRVWDWLGAVDPEKAEDLQERLALTDFRFAHWMEVIGKLWVPQDPRSGLIEQFEGFFALEDINLEEYEPRLRSMQVLLGIEGANQRQVLKQADALMLFYLLRQGAFVDAPVLDGAVVSFSPHSPAAPGVSYLEALQLNWDYYNPRTDHTYGSSLSPAIHAILACQLGKVDEAYEHFMRSALVDLADVRSNAAEGIHAASAGGVWQAVVFGFAGIRLTANGPIASPHLPTGWTRLKFQLQWQGQTYDFDLQPAGKTDKRRKAPTVQAVIFDLDGVITDTSEFHYQAWQRLADEEGLPFDRTLNDSLRGISRRDSLLRLLNGRTVTESEFQAMMDRKNGYYLELIRTITPAHLLPGVAELLTDLRAAGIKIALGSSSKNAPEVLERLGIAHLMDAIADGNSVTQSKPAPDVFLHAAHQLGIAPEQCLVIEDATSGIEAAIRAGMKSIGLGPTERMKEAQLVLPNLDGMRWADILDQFNQRIKRSQTALTIQRLLQDQRGELKVKS